MKEQISLREIKQGAGSWLSARSIILFGLGVLIAMISALVFGFETDPMDPFTISWMIFISVLILLIPGSYWIGYFSKKIHVKYIQESIEVEKWSVSFHQKKIEEIDKYIQDRINLEKEILDGESNKNELKISEFKEHITSTGKQSISRLEKELAEKLEWAHRNGIDVLEQIRLKDKVDGFIKWHEEFAMDEIVKTNELLFRYQKKIQEDLTGIEEIVQRNMSKSRQRNVSSLEQSKEKLLAYEERLKSY